METVSITYDNLEYGGDLFAKLDGEVFHVTKQESFRAIQKDGYIGHNKKGLYQLNIASECSFGRNRGYVCLFDFRSIDEDVFEETSIRYPVLSPSWFRKVVNDNKVWELAYLFLDPNKYGLLIPNSAPNEPQFTHQPNRHYIPFTECWYEGNLPLDHIYKVILVTIIKPLSDRDRVFLEVDKMMGK